MAASRKLGPLPPGSTVGILGSGQLGRMLSTAASRLGLKCSIYSDGPGPACDVAASTTIASYEDETALTRFAAGVQAVTYEFENVPEHAVKILEKIVRVMPGRRALGVAQDRLKEKSFIAELGIAVAPFRRVDSARAAQKALAELGTAAILKTRRLGYDGKGQVSLLPDEDASAAFRTIGGVPAILEQRLDFVREISVILCRPAIGAPVIYDIPQNTHEGGILRRSIVPAPIDEATTAAARSVAVSIAEALNYVGVLAVEMFDLGPNAAEGRRLHVNEIAPRVHNSGHWTIDACLTSQFENHIRAIAAWPLGSAERHSDAEMWNLIGAEAQAWRGLAAETDVCLHLYGKNEPREGRKMGHVTRLFPKGMKSKGRAPGRSTPSA